MNPRRKFLICFIFFAALIFSVRADEKFPVLKVGKQTYTNVTVTSVSTTDIFFTHARGMGNAKLKDLDPALQQHFHYDPAKAQAAEKKLADGNAKFHEQLVSKTAIHPPDETRLPPRGSDLHWSGDLIASQNKARAEHKMVLIYFTGSDWSEWAKKMDQEVLATDPFAAYAESKLVLVRLDFPRQTPQSDDVRKYNDVVAKHFNVTAFPTLLLLNSEGNEIGRQIGYLEGGPSAFIGHLESWRTR